MENDFIEKLTATTRFGKVAVDMGFVTAKQLNVALAEQVEENYFNGHHKLIGKILFENGWITNEQFDSVVVILFKAPV
jgi:hypothetical protein